MFEKGKRYRTVGGWIAEVVWRHGYDPPHADGTISLYTECLYVVHKPGEQDESEPTLHFFDGKATFAFAVNAPPRYGRPLPADLTSEEVPFPE